MRIAIVDDEQSLLRLASHTINDYGKEKNIDIEVNEFLSGTDFLESFSASAYDVIFMDVYMPGMSGIDTVLNIRKTDANVSVIFLTTSESHMKEALSCHAFDYLVKPATRKDFFKVLDECILMLGDKVLSNSKILDIKYKGIDINIPVNQIISVSSNGHLVDIYAQRDEYSVKENFSTVAEKLSECNNFILLNRGILVNMDYIDRFDEGDCYMKNGLRFSVKIKSYRTVRQAYEDYISDK